MKTPVYIGLIVFLSCNSGQKEINNKAQFTDKKISAGRENANSKLQQICWRGKLSSKTNILLYYQIQENLIVGQIIYLDTKEQVPIRVIGTIEDDKNFRLLEFSQTGNITGIISGFPDEKVFNGTWFSPKTRNEFNMSLNKIDTLLKFEKTETSLENIAGDYYYQYSEAGYQGYLTVRKVDQNKISFSILSVTNAPGRNIADVEADTVLAKTDFTYKVPGTDSCEFRVRFFKDFAYINYTRGYCVGMFGFNATIDGIFYKQQ
jgi:hypothetical protein